MGRVFGDKFPQIVAVLAATVSAISDGMSYGWASPVIPILQSKDSPVPIEESDIVWLESIYMIGGFCGLPITIYIVDKLGRKKSILLAAFANLIHWVLISTATNIELIYVGRFLTGVAGDVAFVSAPMFIAEIADQKIRGFLSSTIYIMMLIGILVVYSVAPFVSIPVSSGVGAAFLLIQMSVLPFIPETPYYNLIEGKEEKARQSLMWFRGTEHIDKELQEIKSAVERQKLEKGRPKDLFIVDSNRKAVIIMTVVNSAQHFSGISVILMNLHTILDDAAGIIDSKTAAIIFAVVMLIFATIAATVVDKFGRKILLVASSLVTGASLALLAIYFTIKANGTDITSVNWIPIVAVMIYAGAFKMGLGIVPAVLTAELFPTKVKAMGMTISDAVYVLFAAISIYVYQFLIHVTDIYVPFYIFSVSTIATALFAIFYIPETKGRTLEEIQMILKGQPVPADNSLSSSSDSVDTKL